MSDDPQSRNPGPTDLVNRLRQQLILAQVRIMELEDERDTLAPKLAETTELLAQAQSLADRQSEAAAHLEKVRTDLQAQFEHLRHVQHVTNEALNECRGRLNSAETELATSREAAAALSNKLAGLQRQLEATESLLAASRIQSSELGTLLEAAKAEATSRGQRIQQLDLEVRAMKASRSWRWTAWLRSLERALRGKRQ